MKNANVDLKEWILQPNSWTSNLMLVVANAGIKVTTSIFEVAELSQAIALSTTGETNLTVEVTEEISTSL